MIRLHSAGDLAAAEAAGADINMLRCSVHNGLDALHIRLPGTVGPSVGVADFDAERHILITELTLCHIAEAPPCLCFLPFTEQLLYNSRPVLQLQGKFSGFPKLFLYRSFFRLLPQDVPAFIKALPKTAKMVNIIWKDYVRRKMEVCHG